MSMYVCRNGRLFGATSNYEYGPCPKCDGTGCAEPLIVGQSESGAFQAPSQEKIIAALRGQLAANEALIGQLAMLVRQMAPRITVGGYRERAEGFLKRHGLGGSITREAGDE